ncbi:hypothetical protein BH23CHL5_BH23CHL5_12240 [soil metagenome]
MNDGVVLPHSETVFWGLGSWRREVRLDTTPSTGMVEQSSTCSHGGLHLRRGWWQAEAHPPECDPESQGSGGAAQIAGFDGAGDQIGAITENLAGADGDQRGGEDTGGNKGIRGSDIPGNVSLGEWNALFGQPVSHDLAVGAAVLSVEGDGAAGSVDHVLLFFRLRASSRSRIVSSGGRLGRFRRLWVASSCVSLAVADVEMLVCQDSDNCIIAGTAT